GELLREPCKDPWGRVNRKSRGGAPALPWCGVGERYRRAARRLPKAMTGIAAPRPASRRITTMPRPSVPPPSGEDSSVGARVTTGLGGVVAPATEPLGWGLGTITVA